MAQRLHLFGSDRAPTWGEHKKPHKIQEVTVKMAVKPLGDRVIVERLEANEQTSDGGIIIPDTAKEKPVQGKVVAVGPGAIQEDGTRTPMQVAEGQTVLFGKYSGTEMKVDGAEVLIMRESDILAVIE